MADYSLDRGLPANPEAEKAVLGAVLLDNDLFDVEASELQVRDFFLAAHQHVFAAMAALAEDGKPIDTLTLSEELGGKKLLEAIGGVAYISTLTDGVPRRTSIEFYVKKIKESAAARRLLIALNERVKELLERRPLDEVLGDLSEDVYSEHGAATDKEGPKHISVFVKQLREYNTEVEKIDFTSTIGLTTGIVSVDLQTGGLRNSELTTIGGFTSDGKTSIVDGIIVANGVKGVPVLLFSVEMTGLSITMRLASHLANISHLNILDIRNMTNMHERTAYNEALAQLEKLPIYIDESNVEITEIIYRSRILAKKEGVKLVAVDYLQIVKVNGAKDPRQAVDVIAYALRDLAKRLNIPVIQLSQLSRTEGKVKRPPRLMDLKESSSIEQASHNVWFVYREQDSDERYTGNNFLIFGKNRNGPGGGKKIELSYVPECMKWIDPVRPDTSGEEY